MVKQYVLNSDEYTNGEFLYEKGPVQKDSLPNDKYMGLINQSLAEINDDTIVLTDAGMAYFDNQHQMKVEAEKAEEEAEDAEEQEEDSESQEDTEEEDTRTAAKQLAIAKEAAVIDSRNVATEGVVDVLARTMSPIINGYSALMNAIRPSDPALQLVFDDSTIHRIEKYPYLNIAHLPMPAPEGLQVKYITLVEALKPAVARLEAISANLKDFTQYVASVLTNSDARISTDTYDRTYKELQKQREDAYKHIGKCFNARRRQKHRYGDLINRNGEWDFIYKSAKGLASDVNAVNRTELLKDAAHLKDLLVKVKDAASRKTFEAISPEVVRSIAEGSYQMASELEYYSVIYYRVHALISALNAGNNTLKNAIK